MSDEKNTETPAGGSEETETETGQEPEGGQGTTEDSGGTDDQGTGEGGEELGAEALRKQLTEARKEAAKYRTSARELRESLDKAKSPEDYQAAADRAAKLERELMVERTARTHRLPEELVPYLKGDTEEELKVSAETLAKHLMRTVPGANGGGGLNPAVKPAPTNPAEIAASIPRSRR
ncbi:hypothetical protein AB0P37_08620 [Streptomyces antimycoticus]|uniref:hypothetical protein n=1 Tax=Streptomyces antimycoticus TaxID=68175 RepID=UPI003429A4FE